MQICSLAVTLHQPFIHHRYPVYKLQLLRRYIFSIPRVLPNKSLDMLTYIYSKKILTNKDADMLTCSYTTPAFYPPSLSDV